MQTSDSTSDMQRYFAERRAAQQAAHETSLRLTKAGRLHEALDVMEKAKKHLDATHVDLNEWINRGSAGIRAAHSPGPSVTTPVKSMLPKGLSVGKTTAIVAGVGLLAAGAYALMRKKDEFSQEETPGRTSWVNRVEQQRMRDLSAGRSA